MLVILVGLVIGLFISNWLLKIEYDNKDKGDVYWTYDKVATQPFKYIRLIGGNVTNIAFEQSPHCSVRVLDDWNRNHGKLIETSVHQDTLLVKFIHSPDDMGEERWMKWTTLVRIFAPQLLHVKGFDTNLNLFKLRQKSISIDLSGRSRLEIESNLRNLDTLIIAQRDSTQTVLEMSPESVSAGTHGHSGIPNISSPEAMTIRSVQADLRGNTLLDIGHAQINSLDLQIADSSAIILSGGGLRAMPR